MNSIPTVSRKMDKELKTKVNLRSKKYFWGIVFIIPAIIIFGLFLWFPIVKGIIYSFYQIDFVNGNRFVGLENYRDIFHDGDVLTSVKNTLYYIFLGVILGFWVPCFFAIIISELRRFQGAARIVAYLPNVLPAVVLYGLWRWLYDPIGPINAVLTKIGFHPIIFLSDEKWSMFSLVLMETWQQFGSAMLIYLAALLSVPKELYEAAEIDGASVWQRIIYITLPSIKNVLLLLFVLQLISTSQGYLSQLAILDGGPNNSTMTYVLLIVKYAFTQLNYGAASAMGVVMFLVLIGLVIINSRLSNRGEK